MFYCRKGQAILELAVLGSLIIMAFALAIKYSEQNNRDQAYMHQTFRSTLKAAKNINNSASWQAFDFRRMPNVTNPMELGELQQFSSSNSVLWSDGKKDAAGNDTVPKSYYQLNRGPEIVIDPPAAPVATEVSRTEYRTSPISSTVFNKDESTTQVSTTKTFTAEDKIKGSTGVSGKTISLDSELGPGGKYDQGGGINRTTTRDATW